MRRLRLGRWIAFDETPGSIQISARVVDPDPAQPHLTRVMVAIQPESVERQTNAGPQPNWAAEGNVLLAEDYPNPPQPEPFPLTDARLARMTPEQLYESLIHGPLLQAVIDTGKLTNNAVEGKLRVLPHSGLFRSTTAPGLLTDPVLLDACTHLLGVWHLSQPDLTGRVIFPVEVGAVDWFGPPPPTGAVMTCRGWVESETARTVRHSLDLLGPDGRLWCRMAPLDYWRFNLPFYRCSFRSKEQYWLGEEWPENETVEHRCRVRLVPSNDLRQQVMRDAAARISLSRTEWLEYRALKGGEQERNAWLFRRLAAKEAVRRLWLRLGSSALYSADLHLVPDSPDDYRVEYRGTIPCPHALPRVTATFTDGVAVALAAFEAPVELMATTKEKS
jgi:hypothetical protein